MQAYVNGFTAIYTQWTRVGTSPYLHDTDADYVYANRNNYVIGDFTFPNVTGVSEVWLESRAGGTTDNYVIVSDANGTLGALYPNTTWEWTRLAKNDASALRLTMRAYDTVIIYVRRAYIVYTTAPVSAGVTGSVPLFLQLLATYIQQQKSIYNRKKIYTHVIKHGKKKNYT